MLNNFTLDKETINVMNNFKTIMNKQVIADRLAKETVKKGLKENSKVFKHYYSGDEPEFITMSCISFGLMHLMEEDFYVIKEILGYNYVIKLLKNSKTFIRRIK